MSHPVRQYGCFLNISGLGLCQFSIVQADPAVEVLDIDVEIPVLPVWLAAPQAMRQTPRIRRVWDLLSDGLKASL